MKFDKLKYLLIIIRISFLLLIVFHFILINKVSDSHNEVVEWFYEQSGSIASKNGNSSSLNATGIKTDKDFYWFAHTGIQNVSKGDILIVDDNYFGRPIFLSKKGDLFGQKIKLNLFYYIVFVFTALSLFLKFELIPGGFVILMIGILDIIAFILYFF